VADEFDEALARLLDGDDFSSDDSGAADTGEQGEDEGPGGDRPV
jgi:hypothetical protein